MVMRRDCDNGDEQYEAETGKNCKHRTKMAIHRVIQNYCQGFNNLSYTIHLR